MKSLHVILPLLIACGILAAQSEWRIAERDGQAILIHEWNAKGEGVPSVEGLAEIIASRDKSIPLKHVAFGTYFNNDPILQAEVLSKFKSRHPDILTEAFKSSGNMHNPKVIPLGSKLSECLLATPTLTKINEVFRAHGYTVRRMSHEKFWINKGSEATPFHAIIWLILEPTVKEETQAAP